MSIKQFNSRAPLSVKLDRFRGMTPITSSEKHTTKRIVNFRIGEDGSLQKRCGVRTLFRLPTNIRSLWSGYIHGSFCLYLLAGNVLYAGHLKQKGYEIIGSVASYGGTASFFFLQGTLYLTDGGDHVYRIEGNRLVEAHGYVPLLGKDWDNDNMGEIYEPRNILNRHARITYVVSSPPSIFLRVPERIESVEAIYLNGNLLSTEQYSLEIESNAIVIPELAADDRLEVYLTFERDIYDLRRLFCSMQGSVFFGSPEKNRTFFFGNEQSDTIFCTEYVSPEVLEPILRYYDTDLLYLPEGNEFRVGEGRHPVRGALRHHDNFLIFTEGDTWLGNIDSSGASSHPMISVNSELGCLSSDGYALAPNDPITISRHGLYLWQNEHPELNQCDAVRISQAIDHLLSPEDLNSATLYYDHLRDEIWLNVKTLSQIWIRPRTRDEWFCFEGVVADKFFDADGQVGLIRGTDVAVFDSSLAFDMDVYGRSTSISADYISAPISFGTEKKKNLSRLALDCDHDGALIHLNLCFDEGQSIDRTVFDMQGRLHASLAMRMHSGRFQNLSVEISTSDYSLPVIHSLTLWAH